MLCETVVSELNSPIGLDFFDVKNVKKVHLMKENLTNKKTLQCCETSVCNIFK